MRRKAVPADQQLCEAVAGDQDIAFLRQIFERHTGASPSEDQRRFGLDAA